MRNVRRNAGHCQGSMAEKPAGKLNLSDALFMRNAGGKKEMQMKKALKKFVLRFGPQLCSFAMLIATAAASGCKRNFYQPKEPDGLAEFAGRLKK